MSAETITFELDILQAKSFVAYIDQSLEIDAEIDTELQETATITRLKEFELER